MNSKGMFKRRSSEPALIVMRCFEMRTPDSALHKMRNFGARSANLKMKQNKKRNEQNIRRNPSKMESFGLVLLLCRVARRIRIDPPETVYPHP